MTDTLSADLRALVAAIDPFDGVEADAQPSVLRGIDAGEPLYRDSGHAPARHLAVYFALVDQAALQIHHVKAGVWLFPAARQITATRWVRLADAATWARQSPSPHQVYRFAATLTAALTTAVTTA